jgi:hypothetical protein
MDQAVSIHVTCIDNEYGFTMINVCDRFDGKILASLTITADSLTKEVTIKPSI